MRFYLPGNKRFPAPGFYLFCPGRGQSGAFFSFFASRQG
jgi:hypothetical protein